MWCHSLCTALRYMNAMEVWTLWDSCMSFLPWSNSTNRRFVVDDCSFLRFSVHQRGFLHGYDSFTCSHLLLCTWCNPEEMHTIVSYMLSKSNCSWQVRTCLSSFMIKQILYLLEFTISPEASSLTNVVDVPLEAFTLEVVFFSSCNWNSYVIKRTKTKKVDIDMLWF